GGAASLAVYPGEQRLLVVTALALADRTLGGRHAMPVANVEAPDFAVAAVAFATYFAAGVFAFLYFLSRRALVVRLRAHDAQLVDAVLTFPSVVSRIGTPQVTALVGLCFLGFVPLAILYPEAERTKAIVASVIFASPYIALTCAALWTSAGEAHAAGQPSRRVALRAWRSNRLSR
ncbi:MAG TPA: hypothetical protein VFP36_03120, partial [Usitatibacter sp.]|nr:hypothetical protein [Usitatibacter sp.]